MESNFWPRLLFSTALLFLLAFFQGVFAIISLFIFYSGALPSVDELAKYTPPAVTEIYSADYKRIGKFYVEERYTLPLSQIPAQFIDAVVAAEDAKFFHHRGIDLTGIIRAIVKNLISPGSLQGGSTITQQVAKTFLLTSEKTFARKIKDIILAYRIENHFTKDHILYLYLNQIYFGQGYYGIEAAARGYFGKSANELSLAEIAMIAGLPQAPARYSPNRNFKAAKARQSYVLKRMRENGFISYLEEREANAFPLKVEDKEKMDSEIAPYFTEQVRQTILNNYGEETLLKGGLTVMTTLDSEDQEAAQKAIKLGLEDLDKITGFRGATEKIPVSQIDEYINTTLNRTPCTLSGIVRSTGIVLKVTDEEVWVHACGQIGKILLEDMRWARTPDEKIFWKYGLISKASQALSPGDVVLVKKLYKDPQQLYLSLEQEVEVQGALIAMEPVTGYVRAMVGGYDFAKSKFNRAHQAKRQPGSAFKPIIYAAALDRGFTPSTRIIDSPIVYTDLETDKIWKPDNYTEKFYGETTFRNSLVKSLNVPTIKILDHIGVDYVGEYAAKLGIGSPLTLDLSLALGTSTLTLEELTSVFAVFASAGRKIKPVLIKSILGPEGNILESSSIMEPEAAISKQLKTMENNFIADIESSAAVQTLLSQNQLSKTSKIVNSGNIIDIKTIPPLVVPEGYAITRETAYLMTTLLQAVVDEGTGFAAKALGRPVAGKTGTTNDYLDAWFIGFTPDLVCGVWIGFDDAKTLGKGQTGAAAALPIWQSFMQKALEGENAAPFKAPRFTIDYVTIDKETGFAADSGTLPRNLRRQAFLKGTGPSPKTEKASEEVEELYIDEF